MLSILESENSGLMVVLIAWILIGGFFVLNLFVGAVIENFNAVSSMPISISVSVSLSCLSDPHPMLR